MPSTHGSTRCTRIQSSLSVESRDKTAKSEDQYLLPPWPPKGLPLSGQPTGYARPVWPVTTRPGRQGLALEGPALPPFQSKAPQKTT